ncbi:MAG: type IX secretion system membrane protein PorP/SprF [Melioribacteraceae bacterium]|nr:type IX secretion system membrane protein PorP/SprF [Melioribacteraceae bacterium]
MDSKAIFSNPALISFQNSHFSLGAKSYHMGFFENSQFDYRQGFFTISTPRMWGTRFGAGLNAQYFDSPIFKRGHFGGSASVQLFGRVSLGANASLYHIGYNRNNFVDFDFDDPVFEGGYSKFELNTSAGIYARPIADVEIAAGARNINEPDLSLTGAGANEPMELFGALSYKFGLLKGTFELIQGGRYDLESRVHLEAFSTQGYYARIGSNTHFDSGYIEAQARLFGGFSVNYQYELPINDLSGNSGGSHMFSFVFEFNRIPPLPDRRRPQPTYPDIQRTPLEPDLPPAIVLNSDTDHVKIYDINLTRRVDENTVSEADLESLSAYDLGKLEEQPELQRVPYETTEPTKAPIPETVELEVPISQQYQNTLTKIHQLLSDDILEQIEILITEGDEIRAAGVRNEMRDENNPSVYVSNIVLPTEEDSVLFNTPFDISMLQDSQIIRVEPEAAQIRPIIVTPVEVSNWTLRIFNNNDVVVKEISGNSTLPEFIEWDWQDNNNQLIEPGIYYYNIEWTTQNGMIEVSRDRNLYVQEIQRNITIDITKDLNRIIEDPDNIDIILKNK